jgi:hypothetical protein
MSPLSASNVKPRADSPFPLIPNPSSTKPASGRTHNAIYIASELMHAPSCMICGFNAISLQVPHVHSPTDTADLLFFSMI